MKNILVTGQEGYLMGYIIPLLMKIENITVIPFIGDITNIHDVNHYKSFEIDCIIHFAGPSVTEDWEEDKIEKSLSSIYDGTINLVKLAKNKKAKFIYASSHAVYDLCEYGLQANEYIVGKKAMEQYIIKNIKSYNYLILRIPRIYSIDRKKGLIPKLKDGTFVGDDNFVVKSILSLDEFLKQFMKVFKIFFINNEPILIYDFEKYKDMSIKHIKYEFNI